MIDRRIDLPFLRRLGESMKSGCIALVGPRDNPDPQTRPASPRAALPSRPSRGSPGARRRAAVLIAPYADLPVTRAMQPLKLKEYLATGKPVVVRKLPATAEWADCCDVVETPEEFADAVLKRLESGVPPGQVVQGSGSKGKLGRESRAIRAMGG